MVFRESFGSQAFHAKHEYATHTSPGTPEKPKASTKTTGTQFASMGINGPAWPSTGHDRVHAVLEGLHCGDSLEAHNNLFDAVISLYMKC